MTTASLSVSAVSGQRFAAAVKPTGVYARLSKDKGDGRGGGSLAIDRQQKDCYRARDEYDLSPETIDYPDDGFSAFDPDKIRPAWERMLQDIRDGKLGAVIAWHVDRLTRQPMQLEILWDACKRSGTALYICGIGLVTDLTMLRIQAAIAAKESEDKSRRTKRKHVEKAENGEFSGGRRRFGWEPGNMTRRESEAAVIRDLAARLLAGETLSSLVRWLIAEQIPTAEGGTWTVGNLGQMLRKPALAGLRAHHGELYPAKWDAILTRTDHESIELLLSDPTRRTSMSNANKYLLAGLATCGVCGTTLRGRPDWTSTTNGRFVPAAYSCKTGRHVSRRIELVDAAVEALIIERLSRIDASGALVDDTAADELAELRRLRSDLDERLASSSRRFARGEKSESSHDRDTKSIEDEALRLDVLIRSLVEEIATPERVLEGITGDAAAERWDGLALGRKRNVIRLLCSVELLPAPARRTPFGLDQLRVMDPSTGQPWAVMSSPGH